MWGTQKLIDMQELGNDQLINCGMIYEDPVLIKKHNMNIMNYEATLID